MPILELLLRWNGATMVYTEGRYHVLPVSDAIKGHLCSGDRQPAELARGYRSPRGTADSIFRRREMAKILEPYVREGAIVQADQFRSMIFLAGTPEELTQLSEDRRDFRRRLAGRHVGRYLSRCKRSMLIPSSGSWKKYFGSNAESPLAGMFRFVPLERLGSVMVITFRGVIPVQG